MPSVFPRFSFPALEGRVFVSAVSVRASAGVASTSLRASSAYRPPRPPTSSSSFSSSRRHPTGVGTLSNRSDPTRPAPRRQWASALTTPPTAGAPRSGLPHTPLDTRTS